MLSAAPIVRRVADHGLQFRDLEFARISVPRYSSHGTPFPSFIPIGMPRIPPSFLDCVCYLYQDEDDAKAGANFGGTAFLVMVPSRFEGRGYLYAVTNKHVACRDGASILRINTRDGGADVFPFGPEQWHFDPRFDVAVIAAPLNPEKHRYKHVETHAFVTKEGSETAKIGPGEDVFMVGRFVDHDGGPINRPSVRFGNISVMPAPIEQPDGRMADAYCIDLHSRPGYSGSPVFIYRTPGYDLERMIGTGDQAILLAGTNYLGLLGIHFAQFPELWELSGIEKRPRIEGSVPLVTEGAYVRGLSGMTCVLPAWTILKVLDLPALKAQRERADAREEERRRREGFPPQSE